MVYYGGKELAAAFRTVRNNTIKIAEEIPEGKYDFRFTPDTRSVQQTLAHIAVGTGFQDHVPAEQGDRPQDGQLHGADAALLGRGEAVAHEG